MEKISGFLERFKQLALPNEAIRKELSESIKNMTGIELGITDISVKGNIAYIKCSGVERSEIFQKKNKILEHLKTMDGGGKLEDIR